MSPEDDSRLPEPAQTSRVWLRFGEHDIELGPGETVIGRSPKCQVILDDGLVSRTHARLVVNRGSVTIEDLGSANGVLVNGEKLTRARVLVTGDRIIIGQQSLQLFVRTASTEANRARRFAARTLSGIPAVDAESRTMDGEKSEATRKGDALDLLAGVADKTLALGRGDEAERILSNYLKNLLSVAATRGEVDLATAEKAATYAVRIAEATGKSSWVDFAFELFTVVKRPLPAPVVDRLYDVLRKLPHINAGVLRQYLSSLRSTESEFGPAERFLMRRIEGLEALAALK